jgi:prefoldin subunit 5
MTEEQFNALIAQLQALQASMDALRQAVADWSTHSTRR